MIDITLIIAGETIEKSLPTDWDDITWNTFTDLIELPSSTLAYFAFFTNQDENDLVLIDAEVLFDFLQLLEFLLYPGEMIAKAKPINISVASDTWAKLEYCKNVHDNSDGDFFQSAPGMVERYTRNDEGKGLVITKLSMPEAFPIAHNIYNQFVSFFEMFSELSQNELTPEQIQAMEMADGRQYYEGIEIQLKLNALSKNPLDHPALLQLPAIVIYTNMLAAFRVSAMNQRYQTLTQAKK